MTGKTIKTMMITVIILLLASGLACKLCGPDTAPARENKTAAKTWSRTQICESTENTAPEEPVPPAEPESSRRVVYDSLGELEEDLSLPYIDEAAYEIIKAAYTQIDFCGEFEKGNPETYEEYQEIFRKLLRSEIPYTDMETGEKIYIKNSTLFDDLPSELERCEYSFFDIDGDGSQELYISNLGCKGCFKYKPEEQEIILWYLRGFWCTWDVLTGTGKVQYQRNGQYFLFYQYDENGNEICNTYFSFRKYNDENFVYLVRMPEYAGKEKESVPEELKTQGSFELYRGKWYFRINKEQYEELLDLYFGAYETALEKMKEVTYTYDEFMGYPAL